MTKTKLKPVKGVKAWALVDNSGYAEFSANADKDVQVLDRAIGLNRIFSTPEIAEFELGMLGEISQFYMIIEVLISPITPKKK